MSRPLLCDWCGKKIVESELLLVRLGNENALDCCPSCAKGIRPKAKVGRPRKKREEAAPESLTGGIS